jgi:hypothetical protein
MTSVSSQSSASSTISEAEGNGCHTEALGTNEWFKEIIVIEKVPRSLQRSLPKRQVRFEESVVIVPVPLTSDYSDELLWNKLRTSTVEVCDNVGKRFCTHSNRNTHFSSTPSPIQLRPILFLPPLVEWDLIEFSIENGDWRCACLEDEMCTCCITKELIHPAHVKTKQYEIVFGTGADFRWLPVM